MERRKRSSAPTKTAKKSQVSQKSQVNAAPDKMKGKRSPATSGTDKKPQLVPELEVEEQWWNESSGIPKDKVRWRTLKHNGVLFPPPYEPHGVKMRYNGRPITLTPVQEEVATFYGSIMERDCAVKPRFIENFFREFRKVLGKNHVIQEFSKCDFTPLLDYHKSKVEAKKALSKEEKKRLTAEKKALEEPYMFAEVDGVKYKVGNFRVELPGLFQGRGEHPKTGMIKPRIQPEDITINIGRGEKVPSPPPGHHWKAVVHNNQVTWLAFWRDPITNGFKYVFLAASSKFRGQSDMEKFEKARRLRNHVAAIRRDYESKMRSDNEADRQLGTAISIIDKLALRAGNEKGDDEADTVGCCSLRVSHIDFEEPDFVHFDFLGKDSIRYQRRIQVDPMVFKNLKRFKTKPATKKGPNGKVLHGRRRKKPDEDIFDLLTVARLNKYLSSFMPGLSAKVFRTYNASYTLQQELDKTPPGLSPQDLHLYYTRCNRQVAILCNHQRALPKTHAVAVARLGERLEAALHERELLRKDIRHFGGKSEPLRVEQLDEVLPMVQARRVESEAYQKKVAEDAERERIERERRIRARMSTEESDDDVPLAELKKTKTAKTKAVVQDDSDSSDDDVPLVALARGTPNENKAKAPVPVPSDVKPGRATRSNSAGADDAVKPEPGAVQVKPEAVKDEDSDSDLQLADLKKRAKQIADDDSDSESDFASSRKRTRNSKPVKQEAKDLKEVKERKPPRNLDTARRALVRIDDRIKRLTNDIIAKEELKNFSLTTSRTNYLDPRISIAWCLKWEVPVKKIFSKSLLEKFPWALHVDQNWSFDVKAPGSNKRPAERSTTTSTTSKGRVKAATTSRAAARKRARVEDDDESSDDSDSDSDTPISSLVSRSRTPASRPTPARGSKAKAKTAITDDDDSSDEDESSASEAESPAAPRASARARASASTTPSAAAARRAPARRAPAGKKEEESVSDEGDSSSGGEEESARTRTRAPARSTHTPARRGAKAGKAAAESSDDESDQESNEVSAPSPPPKKTPVRRGRRGPRRVADSDDDDDDFLN